MNGRLFAQFVENNYLTIVNSLSLCKGLITRSRLRQGELIQSTIDFYVLPYISEIIIDTDKKYRLTNYTNMFENGTIVEADHKPMILKVHLSIVPEKPERTEVLDFKNKEGLLKFKVNTSEAGCFTKCFLNTNSVSKQVSQWKDSLDKLTKKSFHKNIRTKNLKKLAADSPINTGNKLAKLDRINNTNEANTLDLQISQILAKESISTLWSN